MLEDFKKPRARELLVLRAASRARKMTELILYPTVVAEGVIRHLCERTTGRRGIKRDLGATLKERHQTHRSYR